MTLESDWSARIRATSPPSSLVIVGQPVGQSLSPVIQNAALSAAGLHVRYDRREVAADELPRVLDECAMSHTGGNITMPHKEAAFAAASRPSALSERVGAANTFWFDDGVLCVHNTDVFGVMATISKLCPTGIRASRVALLGAGGSAAATLVALDLLGCNELVVWARTTSRATAIAERVGVSVTLAKSADDAVIGAALVINCTPFGMRDDSMPVDPSLLWADCAIFDLVYRRGESAWVRACRARGLVATDGLLMLVEQGAEAFRVWFNQEPDVASMWHALRPDVREFPRDIVRDS